MDNSVEEFSARANTRPPMRLGQRYDAQRFLPDPGNTVVCHLDAEAPEGLAVLRARKAMQALPEAERFLYTPASSLHMTIFEGVLDNRRRPDAWPSWIAPDAPVQAVTDAMVGRFQGFIGQGPIRVRVQAVRPGGLELCGASAEDEAILRAWRDALAEAFGYRQTVHDRYAFHMTFAYPLDWLPDDLVPAWQAGLEKIQTDLIAAAPILPLKPPAFCRFADMTRFDELVVLGS